MRTNTVGLHLRKMECCAQRQQRLATCIATLSREPNRCQARMVSPARTTYLRLSRMHRILSPSTGRKRRLREKFRSGDLLARWPHMFGSMNVREKQQLCEAHEYRDESGLLGYLQIRRTARDTTNSNERVLVKALICRPRQN